MPCIIQVFAKFTFVSFFFFIWFDFLFVCLFIYLFHVWSSMQTVGMMGSIVCIYIYWARGLIRGHLVVQGQINAIVKVRISKWRNEVWSWGSRKVVWGAMPPRLSKANVRKCGLPSRATFRKFLLIRIHFMKALDKGKLWNI